jgi:FMN phosphatase YigB (HAD superfamily)
MSKQEEAGLILKLYELRREATLRKARDWYFRDFNPQTIEDFRAAMFGENSGHLRMVVSYWDMAAALVNDGAISAELFTATNGEHFGVFAKVEPLLPEIRAAFAPNFATEVEKLIDTTPDGRKRVTKVRERMAGMRAQAAK